MSNSRNQNGCSLPEFGNFISYIHSRKHEVHAPATSLGPGYNIPKDNQHRISGPSSSSSLQVFQKHTNTQHPLVEEEEKVMIKVKCQEDVIRFEFRLSLGVVKLSEEVARRLNLDVGSFKLKYTDEDNETILLTCDDDLKLCPKVRTSTGNTCINLFVPKEA